MRLYSKQNVRPARGQNRPDWRARDPLQTRHALVQPAKPCALLQVIHTHRPARWVSGPQPGRVRDVPQNDKWCTNPQASHRLLRGWLGKRPSTTPSQRTAGHASKGLCGVSFPSSRQKPAASCARCRWHADLLPATMSHPRKANAGREDPPIAGSAEGSIIITPAVYGPTNYPLQVCLYRREPASGLGWLCLNGGTVAGRFPVGMKRSICLELGMETRGPRPSFSQPLSDRDFAPRPPNRDPNASNSGEWMAEGSGDQISSSGCKGVAPSISHARRRHPPLRLLRGVPEGRRSAAGEGGTRVVSRWNGRSAVPHTEDIDQTRTHPQ